MCEYRLCGLDAAGSCPECGSPIAPSIDHGLCRERLSERGRAIFHPLLAASDRCHPPILPILALLLLVLLLAVVA